MLCPHCQIENREGRRFCAGCGKALPALCPACGFANEAGEKFCGGCGRDLAAKPEAKPSPGTGVGTGAGDRRPVTVMFADLSGYTALSASLDPEDTHRLLRRFYELADGAVVEFGGTVDKHIGDSVMALFGAPVSHGNDPERAIRAAMAIHAAMAGLGAEFGRPLSVHLGIALGEVVASGLGSQEHAGYTVTGEAANLAARLMERAAPGETLVAAALYEATQSTARYEDLGPIDFKGIGRLERVYRLVDLKSATGLEQPMVEQPMVGRRSEMAQLLALLGACRRERRGGAVAVRGDPGIGKSRLIRALMREATAHGFRCHSGLILDFGARRGEDALAAVVASLIGLPRDGDAAARLATLDARIAAGVLPESDRPFLHDLLGLDQRDESRAVYAAMDAGARLRGKSAMLERLLRFASKDRACFIAIEDAHWADAQTCRLLATMTSAARALPIVLAITTRIEGDPFDAAWRAQSGGGLSAIIDLHPLRAEDAKTLAASVINKADAFTQQCIERAEGNPLFLEQLLRSHLADPTGKLPHSLQGVVLARLDSLGEADKQALQAASVLGQRFALDDLRSVMGAPDYDPRAVIQRQLLRPEGELFLFAHALIRDGIYASLTRERKRGLHLKAAARFASRDPVLEAEHLDRAEDAGAPGAYLRAAGAEAAAYRTERAIALATRGLELAIADEDRVRLGLVAGRLRLDAGQAKPARAAYEIAVGAAAVGLDRGRGLAGLAAAERMLANLDSAIAHLDAAAVLVSEAEPTLQSEIHYLRGNLHFARGDSDACASQHRLALEAARLADSPEWKARARSGLGDAAYLRGRVSTALRHFRACVDLAERHDLLRIIPANRGMVGNCLMYCLESNEALTEIEAARETAIRLGDRFGEMFSYECEAYTMVSMRRWQDSVTPTERGLEIALEIGARRYESVLRMAQACIELNNGQRSAAEKQIDMAMKISEETGPGFCGPAICAKKAIALGNTDEARRWLARGEDLLQTTGLIHNHAFFRADAIDWAMQAGDWPLAARMVDSLVDYAAAEPIPFVDLVSAHARALIALNRNPEDAQALESLERCRAVARAADFRLEFPAVG